MRLKMQRVILFTRQMAKMTAFYRDVMGLKLVTDEKGWRELDAGGVRVALHSGPPTPVVKGPKLGFMTKDVAALVKALNARGGKFGKVRSADGLALCDGEDPDGNVISLSNR